MHSNNPHPNILKSHNIFLFIFKLNLYKIFIYFILDIILEKLSSQKEQFFRPEGNYF